MVTAIPEEGRFAGAALKQGLAGPAFNSARYAYGIPSSAAGPARRRGDRRQPGDEKQHACHHDENRHFDVHGQPASLPQDRHAARHEEEQGRRGQPVEEDEEKLLHARPRFTRRIGRRSARRRAIREWV